MFFLCNFIYIFNVNAATINATSCSQNDVQTAINSASDGDTVIVPAGICTWTTIHQNTPAVTIPNTKGITLLGAGIDQTIIIDNTDTDSNKEVAIKVSGSIGRPFRISGFTIDNGGKGTSYNDGGMSIGGNCDAFRIDNIKFVGYGSGTGGIVISGKTYGVIDHNIFLDVYMGAKIYGDRANNGADSWLEDQSMGTARAVYMEDNNFLSTGSHKITNDAYRGARFVFRYNTVVDATMSTHGACTSGSMRGVRHYEIYENSFSLNYVTNWSRALHLRGGTGVIYNNTFSGDFAAPICVVNYRTGDGAGHTQCGSNWNRCDGSDPLDGNADATGWPCLDQIGRSTGAIGSQSSDPLYEWNNTLNGTDADISVYTGWNATCTNPSMADHIQAKRDYFNDTVKPGYTPYTYPHPLIAGGGGSGPAKVQGVEVKPTPSS